MQDNMVKVVVLLFVIYWFFVKPQQQHHQKSELAHVLQKMKIDTDGQYMKYFMLSIPFFYALRKDLGIQKLFDLFKINDMSEMVQI